MRLANSRRKNMKTAGWLVTLMTIAIGMAGIVATDNAITLRRLYFATPGRFYAAGVVRVAMGLVLILAASSSRWPRTLRAFVRDVPASHRGEPLRTRTRASDHGMGDDAGNRAPARRRHGGLSERGLRSLCLYKEVVQLTPPLSPRASTDGPLALVGL